MLCAPFRLSQLIHALLLKFCRHFHWFHYLRENKFPRFARWIGKICFWPRKTGHDWKIIIKKKNWSHLEDAILMGHLLEIEKVSCPDGYLKSIPQRFLVKCVFFCISMTFNSNYLLQTRIYYWLEFDLQFKKTLKNRALNYLQSFLFSNSFLKETKRSWNYKEIPGCYGSRKSQNSSRKMENRNGRSKSSKIGGGKDSGGSEGLHNRI